MKEKTGLQHYVQLEIPLPHPGNKMLYVPLYAPAVYRGAACIRICSYTQLSRNFVFTRCKRFRTIVL